MNDQEQTLIIASQAQVDTEPQAAGPTAACNHLPEGTRLEGFEITELLGFGGFGLVYKAWDPTLEREVALKEYLPESLAYRDGQGWVRLKKEGFKETFDAGMKSFVNEAKLLARFDHPALIKVFRFWESNGTAYMVMPYYKGQTLKARQVSVQSPLSEKVLLDMILPLCDALDVMHQQHCIHRDVSPDNIIVQEENGKPILLDFGAARRAIGQCSQSFTVILKAGYAPLEQYAEIPHYQQGPWTDVYALAALAHYLIRGKAPAPAVGRMVHDTHRPLEEDESLPFGKTVLRALDWGLQIEPEKRPQSMTEFRSALLGETWSPSRVGANEAPENGDSLLTAFLNDQPVSTEDEKQSGSTTQNPTEPSLTFKQWMMWIGLLLIPALCLIFVLSPWDAQTDHALAAAPLAPAPPWSSAKASPARISTDTQFEQALRLADPAWTVELTTPKHQLLIDKDFLQLRIKSANDGYLSVWVESPTGSVDALLLNTSTQAKHDNAEPVKIKAGEPMDFPDISEPLLANGPAGNNRILAIVSDSKIVQTAPAPLDAGYLSSINFGAATVDIEQVAKPTNSQVN